MHISAFLVENVYMDTHSIENSKHMFNMIRNRVMQECIQGFKSLSLRQTKNDCISRKIHQFCF